VTTDNIDHYDMVTDQLTSFASLTIFSINMQQTLPPKVRAYRESHSYDIIIIIISSSSSISSRSSSSSSSIVEQE
jgi:hypothetical protein